MTSTTLRTSETLNVVKQPAGRLPQTCSFRAGHPDIDTLIMGTSSTAIGEFRCPVEHPAFVDSGPISDPLFVFPRTAVWIQHEGAPPFHSDPTLITIYNRGQRYSRRASSSDGDRCDWFALSDDLARDIAAVGEPAAADAVRPFNRSRTASSPSLYLKQRVLLQRARRGELTALELDECVIEMAVDVLSSRRAVPQRRGRRAACRRRAEVVDVARAIVVRDPTDNLSLGDVSRAVGTSPFHLCRLFRAETGRALRSYRNEIRCRLALEDLALGSSTISAIAHRFGFASHAHFVRVSRQVFGGSPGMIRNLLAFRST